MQENYKYFLTVRTTDTTTPNVDKSETFIIITGTGSDNTLAGANNQDDILYGTEGNDYLYGHSGNDNLFGQDGNDMINAGFGNDAVYAGDGNDIIYIDDFSANDIIDGGTGVDTAYLYSSTNTETLTLGTNGITINGQAINMVSVERFALYGNGGNDTLTIGNLTTNQFFSVAYYGGSGNDTIDASGQTNSSYGLSLSVGTGNDSVKGGSGNDIIAAYDPTNDSFDGGAGLDALHLYGNAADNDVFVLGADGLTTNGQHTSISNIEQLFLNGNHGNDTFIVNDLTGSSFPTTNYSVALYGSESNDIMDASGQTNSSYNLFLSLGTGNDTAKGGSGNDSITDYDLSINDSIDGGTGTDSARLYSTTATEIFTLAADGLTIDGQYVSVTNMENFSLQNMGGDDTLIINTLTGIGLHPWQNVSYFGSAGNEIIDASGQSNTNISLYLYAEGGNDTVKGGAGNDYLDAGAGSDAYVFSAIGEGVDTLSDASGASDIIIINTNSATLSLLNFENVDADADGATDDLRILYNDSQIDVLNHYSGTGTIERINFNGGASYLGYTLNSSYNISTDNNGDFSGASTTTNDVVAGNIAGQTLDGGGTGTTGAGNDLLFGNSDNDTLNGGTGDDLLIGGLGDDIINGGIGKDVMNGGGGNDIFLFNSLNELGLGTTRDVIADFTIGADKIDLSGIDAIAGGSDQAFTFVSTPFTMEGQVSYNAGIISINTDADTAAEYEIQLIGTPPATLSASDFIL